MLIGMFTSRVVLQTLGVENYGLYNVVGGIVVLFSFLQSGLVSSTSRFLTIDIGYNNISKLKKTFTSSFSLHIIIGILLLIIFETIGLYLFYQLNIPAEKSEICLVVYQLSIISTIISFVMTPFSALIIAHEKMSFYSYIGILDVVLKLAILYLLVFLPFNKLLVYSFLLLGTTIIYVIINIIYCFISFKEVTWKISIVNDDFKPLLSFTGWTMLGSVAYLSSTQGINYLLNIFCGAYANAARAIAIQVQSIISKFIQGFQTAINPQITKSYSKGDYIEMQKLIFRSSRYSVYVLSVIIFPVFFYLPKLLDLWLGSVPRYAVIFTRIMVLSAFIEALDNPLRTALNATGSIKNIQIINSILYLISTIVSAIFLYFKYEPQYVFIIVSFSAFLIIPFRLHYLNMLINLSIKSYLLNVIRYIIILLSFALILYQVIGYVKNPIIGILLTIVSLLIFIFYLLNKEEQLYIKSKIIKLYGRL